MQCVLEGIHKAGEEVDSLGGTVILKRIPHLSGRDTIEAMEYMREQGGCGVLSAQGKAGRISITN